MGKQTRSTSGTYSNDYRHNKFDSSAFRRSKYVKSFLDAVLDAFTFAIATPQQQLSSTRDPRSLLQLSKNSFQNFEPLVYISLPIRTTTRSSLAMLRAPSKNNMSNIRDLFAHDRDHKEKVPPDLRRALALLKLNGFEDLEERFLSTDAFLRPWSMFRDSMFLLFADAMPRSTQIIPVDMNTCELGISRLDILWFYTQFDEGTLRYDSRADKYSDDYTPDTRVYGIIDKRKWRVEEYEKHLYTWLLQEFKIGKGYSPWRFEWFELRNICTVWEEVFVPIVNAVRASYHPLGRRHYGRLALFIEARCPSQLAFPENNVGIPEGTLLSPTPYRVVSVPKKLADDAAARGVLSKKHYDVTEKELRDVYPQYGGLVERPKFKHKMEEWLAEQRLRADRRKGYETRGRVSSGIPRIVKPSGSQSPTKKLPRSSQESSRNGSVNGSPIKRYAEGIKRSLSNAVSSVRNREEKKSPLHGVTRQLHFPDHSRGGSLESWNGTAAANANGEIDDSTIITSFPRPHMYRESTGASVYSSVRSSNPTVEGNVAAQAAPGARAYDVEPEWMPGNQRVRADTDDSVFSPMIQLSAIPRPLQADSDSSFHHKARSGPGALSDASSGSERGSTNFAAPSFGPERKVHEKKSSFDIRLPSYEGSEYQKEISLTDLHTQRMFSTRSPEPKPTRTPATRLPAPIVPVPYCGPRVASADTPSKTTTPTTQPVLSPPKPVAMPVKAVFEPTKSTAWPGPSAKKSSATSRPDEPAPQKTAWPGTESDDDESLPPPIPAKSPERQIRNPRSRQPALEDNNHGHEVLRIVSRDNIRSALGDLSRESSMESLAGPMSVEELDRGVSPIKQQLQTYNTHLFPRKDERKGTPVGNWVGRGA